MVIEQIKNLFRISVVKELEIINKNYSDIWKSNVMDKMILFNNLEE